MEGKIRLSLKSIILQPRSLPQLFFTLLFAFTASRVFAQDEIPVDMHTGRPVIQIPLVTISDHDLSETVGLTYNASGIRLEDQGGIAGLGWDLQAGGGVYRQVRGLPDDYAGPGSD